VLIVLLLATGLGELAAILWLLRLLRRSDAASLLLLERQLRLLLDKKAPRRRAARREKLLFILLARLIPDWRGRCLAFTPRTLLRWKRQWVAILMRRQQRRVGRPRLSEEIRELIRRMARDNAPWGPGRILRELAKLRLFVSRNTVRRYIREVRGRTPRGDERWSTFIRAHADVTLAMDFAVDYFPTITGRLKRVWILALLEIGSRRLLCLTATEYPTHDWIAQQLRDAIPSDHTWRFLVHDNDQLFRGVDDVIRHLGIAPRRTPPDSPQANPYAERFIGTLRRELLDWIWPLGVRHLNRLLRRFTVYYNHSRPHMGLGGAVPNPPAEPRILATERHALPAGTRVSVTPHLGGLHHEYRLERAA
jgi:transposase InsO family protein